MADNMWTSLVVFTLNSTWKQQWCVGTFSEWHSAMLPLEPCRPPGYLTLPCYRLNRVDRLVISHCHATAWTVSTAWLSQQVAQLSQRNRVMLHVTEYFINSLKVTQGHSVPCNYWWSWQHWSHSSLFITVLTNLLYQINKLSISPSLLSD